MAGPLALVSNPILFGILFGFVPAMALLWWVLGRYEGFFDEKRVFKFLLIGLVAGALIVGLELAVFRFNLLTDLAWALLLFIVGYSGLEVLAKAVVLNWRTLRGRRDTPFYAASYGLGFGAGISIAVVTQRAIDIARFGGAVGETTAGWIFFALLLQLTVASLLLHAATAIMVGQGVAEDILIVRGLHAMAALAPLHLAEWLIFNTAWAGSILLPTVVLLFSIGVILWTIRGILDKIVPPEVARAAGLEKRRRVRRGDEGAGSEPHEREPSHGPDAGEPPAGPR